MHIFWCSFIWLGTGSEKVNALQLLHSLTFRFSYRMQIYFRGATVLMPQNTLGSADWNTHVIKNRSREMPKGVEPEIFYSRLSAKEEL